MAVGTLDALDYPQCTAASNKRVRNENWEGVRVNLTAKNAKFIAIAEK